MAILGIKTTPDNLAKHDDLDALFSGDSDGSSFSLDFVKAPSNLQPTPFNPPSPSLPNNNQVNSLEEALPRINNFLSRLKELDIGPNLQTYVGDIYFIPENAAPIELSSLLLQLHRAIKEKNENEKNNIYNQIFSTDFSTFPETILAQIELLKWIKEEKVDLESFLNSRVDSRILSLIHFVLAKDQETKVSAYHLISSIEEMLKFPMLAPISAFFLDFNIQKILKQLAIELVELFPRNPILPSCIEKISEFSPESRTALDLIPTSDDDSTDDFSSDFFESLKPNTNAQPVITLHSNTETNFLDFSSEFSRPIITLTEPPTTVTYKLENGSNQMGMPFFQEWVESLRVCQYDDDFISNFMRSREPTSYISELPETADISLISYHLPVIHLLNSNSYTIIDKGSPFPQLLKAEFQIQDALLHNKTDVFNQSLAYLAKFSEQLPIKNKNRYSKKSSELIEKIKPLEKLRKLPKVIQKPNDEIEKALAISDFEIAIHGRSLLTLAPICKILPDLNLSSTIVNNHWRAKLLYNMYANNNFTPYISYRISFALALNLMDRDPHLACSFIFEGLYVLLKLLPLNMTHIARSGYLLAAEIFDQINSYYYSALMIDSFFITDVKDVSSATTFARLATKNNDYLRSAFYYTQSLKQYISRKMVDESIYISQVISTDYAENGLNYLAISLLEAMLYKSYSINFGIIPSKRQAGTLQNKKCKPLIPSANISLKTNSQTQQFNPDPQSLNTSLLALTLTDLLMKERMFDYAQVMLHKLQEGKDRIRRLANFMQSRFYYKQNRVQEFFDSIPKSEIKICLNRKSNPRLSILSASTFDTNASYLRMIANMCFRQRMYIDSVFWSEIIIHSSCKGSLKEFGYGNLLRGLSLYELWIRTKTKLALPNQLNKLQEPFGKFLPTRNVTSSDFYSDSDSDSDSPLVSANEIKKSKIFKEAMSSFYIAKQCFDRVACFHLYLYSTLMFCDLFINYGFEVFYKQQKSNQSGNQLKISASIRPLKMLTELLNSKEPFQLPFQFTPFAFTLDNIPAYFNAVEAVISKSLSPIDIIHYQTLRSQYYFLKNSIDECHKYFDFAYNNFQRYFVCGGQFIPRFFSQRKQHRIQIILEELLQLLINLDSSFINDRLILFDILNDVRLMENNKRKSREIFSSEIVSPSTDIQPSFIKLSNPNYPDFQPVLSAYSTYLNNTNFNSNSSSSSNGPSNFNSLNRNSNIRPQVDKYNDFEDYDPTTMINYYIRQIDSNIRLFEAEKIREDDMTWKNRRLCQKIEMAAETLRRQHQTDLPVETQYSYALKVNPKTKRLVFVFRVFNKIGVYSPMKGLRKIIDIFDPELMQLISLKLRNEIINDSISLFNTQFLEFFLALTTTSFSKYIKITHAKRIQKKIATMLFSSIIEPKRRPNIPDNHFLGGNRVFGKHLKGSLVTMDCGDEPIVLLTTVDLACLPYETMIKRQTVIRSTSFTRLLLRSPNNLQLNSSRSSIKLSSTSLISPNVANTHISSDEKDENNEEEENEYNFNDTDFEDYYYDSNENNKRKIQSFPTNELPKKSIVKNERSNSKKNKKSNNPVLPSDLNNKTKQDKPTLQLPSGANKRSVTPPNNSNQSNNNNNLTTTTTTIASSISSQTKPSTYLTTMKTLTNSNSDLNKTTIFNEIDIEDLKSVLKPMIIRSRLEDPARAVLPLNDFIYTFGGKHRFDYSLNIERLDEPLMQPLFCQKETNEYYAQKYYFLTILDEAKIVPILSNNLILCSYDDLCEMPSRIEGRLKDFRYSSFMFIPNIYFKEAIKEMKKIFKRHEKRIRYAISHPNELNDQLCMLADRYSVLTTMQATLIQTFNYPFPLFTPLP
ncbi:hypothetical protein M9Y10_035176 [Tritrichomonas musculus]|uniref:Clu domain-containing protein n=1 Tax=Tritrichomonas musculus TaxID=1915356 RepID=A0ABR2KGZ2_9EUKA